MNQTKSLTIPSLFAIVSLSLFASAILGGPGTAEAAPPSYKIEIAVAPGTIACNSGPNSGNSYYAELRTTSQDAPVVKKKGGSSAGWLYVDDGEPNTVTTMDTFVSSGQSNGRTFSLGGIAGDDFCSAGAATAVSVNLWRQQTNPSGRRRV